MRERSHGHGKAHGWHGRRVLYVLAATVLMGGGAIWASNPCAGCHEDQVKTLLATSHRGVANDSSAFCAACHGDPAKHLESGDAKDIRGPSQLAAWGPERQSAACLTCHGSSFPNWQETPHANRVSCWDCHGVQALHFTPKAKALPAAQRHRSWALCTSCHGEVKAQFMQEFHHPVQEGLVDCVDCHDIHGKRTTEAPNRVAESACLKCHEEQAGPYLFQHPAMDQGCTTCHKPHGSWNRVMLVSVGNGVCLSCHLQSTFPGVGQVDHEFNLAGGATCWDCHSEVHGSNTTPDFNPRGRRRP